MLAHIWKRYPALWEKGALDRAMATPGSRTGTVFRSPARGAASPGMEGCSVIESGCPFATTGNTFSAIPKRCHTAAGNLQTKKIARLHVTVHHRAIFASLPASWPSPGILPVSVLLLLGSLAAGPAAA